MDLTEAPQIADIEAYLAAHEQKDLLRFITCGSVDDGKSTLIGRLLYETENVFIDQANSLVQDSLRHGNAGEGEIDYSLLLDGLKAEREQGITIDVAYRYFTTQARKFIIADCPGHEQYTRNMITGGSTADLAIVLIDARHGVLTQTKRHSYIANLLGIRQVVVAVNKMDLVDYDAERFAAIVADYQAMTQRLPHADVDYTFIPLSAKAGDCVAKPSPAMTWYEGPTLLQVLESAPVGAGQEIDEFFYPVQYVLRPNLDFRGFSGTVLAGAVQKGERITALPSGRSSTVTDIVTFDGSRERCQRGEAVTLTLADEIDISRGDVLVAGQETPPVGAALEAMLVWMTDEALRPGQNYIIKHLCNSLPGQITSIDYRVDPNSLEHCAEVEELSLNEIAKVHLRLNRSVVFDSYRRNRLAGAFIVIDRITNATVGAGMITGQSAYEAEHVRRLGQGRVTGDPVSAADRAARHNQRPAVVWLSGGDETQAKRVARELEKQLFDDGFLPYVLDLASVSLDLRRIVGHAEPPERLEGVRWAVALSRLTADTGLVAIAVAGAVAEEGSGRTLEVYLDDDPLGGERLLVEDDSLPQLRYADGGADAQQTARSIADYLRQEGVIGYFRDDDQIVI